MTRSDDHQIGPGGLHHKSMFHHVSSEHKVRIPESGILERHRDDGRVETQEVQLQNVPVPDSQPHPGWIGWAGWSNDSGRTLTEIAGSYTVPEDPIQGSGQTIFLFLGMQKAHDDTSELFQPVLQWGQSAAGGGEWWGLSCWYLKDGMIVFSTLEKVSPGDKVHSIMRRFTLGDRIRWTARAAVRSAGVATELHVLQDLDLAWCYTALEAYGPDGMACDMYPGSEATRFEELVLTTQDGELTPQWEPKVLVADCGQGIEIRSAQEVLLRYRSES